jgi:hypothetical protein
VSGHRLHLLADYFNIAFGVTVDFPAGKLHQAA